MSDIKIASSDLELLLDEKASSPGMTKAARAVNEIMLYRNFNQSNLKLTNPEILFKIIKEYYGDSVNPIELVFITVAISLADQMLKQSH